MGKASVIRLYFLAAQLGMLFAFSSALLCHAATSDPRVTESSAEKKNPVRIATFNVSLYRTTPGSLAQDLADGEQQDARKLAAIIQTVRPDVLLINEIDYEENQAALGLFLDKYLAIGQADDSGETLPGIEYPYVFAAPSNTGVDSGLDVNGDRKRGTPEDAWGYGRYPGQYGMAVVSRYPINRADVRTFQKLRWSQMPGAKIPFDPDRKKAYYSKSVWGKLRLSSKSHWDIPIEINGRTLHLLASHPTPPAFDGAEDRNGCRNHDEIFFWKWYVAPADGDSSWIEDDEGNVGGLQEDAFFVIAGDLNADPVDGSGLPEAINALLASDRITDPEPHSKGGEAASRSLGHVNETHRGLPSMDTAQFNARSVGNLRVDYCLPSSNLRVVKSEVFWPAPDQPGASLVEATDHRMVWIDIAME